MGLFKPCKLTEVGKPLLLVKRSHCCTGNEVSPVNYAKQKIHDNKKHREFLQLLADAEMVPRCRDHRDIAPLPLWTFVLVLAHCPALVTPYHLHPMISLSG